jgi:hypothetical protein
VKFAAEEIKRLQARKKAFEGRFERMKEYVISTMEESGRKRLEGKTAAFLLRACPAALKVLDEAAIPMEYKDPPANVWTVNNARTKAALQAGIEVPGADLEWGNTVVRK